MQNYNINDINMLSIFLGTLDVESWHFTAVREDLNYSLGAIMRVFGKYFKDIAEAKLYEHNPEKLANKVYANRCGNGDEASGDGWKYRGRGYIQLTLKCNYISFNNFLHNHLKIEDDVVENPDLVATKYPMTVSGWYFYDRGIFNLKIDKVNRDSVIKVTKYVNPALLNLKERIDKSLLYYSLLRKK
ncbi:MAG: glycoside hydrolase family 19 protein [Acidobacterium ailaaui]|nr:glycoside hydrolase family 19 protein [Pseudacidobacterium ailaaui]